MKRTMTRLGALLLLSAAALVSCTRELPAGPESPLGGKDLRKVSLRIEGQDADTRVAVNDGSGKCSWLKGDAIAMYITGSGANTYSNLTVDHTEECVQVGLPGNQEIGFYSVYPAGASVAGYYGNTELRVRYNNAYTFPKMGADSLKLWSPLPMVAANTENGTALNSISFYHVGGLLRLVLSNYSKSDVTSIKVTLEGMKQVTGIFTVNNPATLAADVTFQEGIDAAQNVITYSVPSGLNASLPDELWVNVPLPTGDYSAISGVKVDVSSASSPRSLTRKVQWSKIRHGQGKHIQMDLSGAAGALSYVAIGSTDDVTLWKGETRVRRAIAYDAADIAIPSASITWASSNPSVAQVLNNGTVTAMGAGTAVLTATATAGGVTKTESFTLHVNEITGITLDRRTLYARKGTTTHLKATVQYTTNGTVPEVPKVSWSSSVPAKATVAQSRTVSGERNAINPLALGSTVITASVPANSYGTNVLNSVTANVTVIGAKYIPGAFSVSPTKQVFFGSGNLQVNYTNENGSDKREWLFSEHQWDYYDDDMSTFPVPAGTTVRISHFAWATAGVKNPGGDYGYDSGQVHYNPHDMGLHGLPFNNDNNIYGYGPSDYYSYPLPTYSYHDYLWAFGISVDISAGNTWNDYPELRKYCDWGVHFDDEGYGSDSSTSGTWFTMSVYEWQYLLSERPNATLLSGIAMIFDEVRNQYLYGFVILPDNFDNAPEGCSFTPVTTDFASNVFSTAGSFRGTSGTWAKMEEYGAVFLPSGIAYQVYGAQGGYYGKEINSNGISYWSSSGSSYPRGSSYNGDYSVLSSSAYSAHFAAYGRFFSNDETDRRTRLPVRLVHE